MKIKILKITLFFLFLTGTLMANMPWKAYWITAVENQNATNTWIAYHKTFQVPDAQNQAIARIAVDSKYWLWINGELVVFEGQLKRGPTPVDTYFDEVDIAPYLKKGINRIAILSWYFGKDGFSHNSSGEAALLFECRTSDFELISDDTWMAIIHPSFGYTDHPHPNFRLPESNIRFDARRGDFDFTEEDFNPQGWRPAKILGKYPMEPWNELVKRPIPLWKDYGLKDYTEAPGFPFMGNGDTIVCKLPYNAHVTPWFKIESEEGKVIHILTDHYAGGGPVNVRGEYITGKGIQEYENLGWMNGHHVYYVIPAGVKVLDLKYRETGYNAEFTGSFTCNDPFYNRLWEKAVRTLYITMRDTYMDCPDRERSQWWGDMVVESGEAFYALSPESRFLTTKGILELINWQREDSTIYAPIPEGNWDKELPGQMLASIGYFGFWNYYMNSGDLETIKMVYDGVRKYLGIWKLDERGVLQHREGGWYWGDWGINADKALLINEWYYLALEGYKRMSDLLGYHSEVTRTEEKMAAFKKSFNNVYWNGDHYRSDHYQDEIDDRGQALAVVAGLADPGKFDQIFKLLQSQMYASPYMEKYVIEALFLMGQPDYALERLKLRFSEMVEHPDITTLWEGWGIGRHGYGGGSVNHAWSGGGLTILSQYVAGVYPLEAGYTTFAVKPTLSVLDAVSATVPSVKGKIDVEINRTSKVYTMNVRVPEGTAAHVYVPEEYDKLRVNNILITKGNRAGKSFKIKKEGTSVKLELPSGKYSIIASK